MHWYFLKKKKNAVGKLRIRRTHTPARQDAKNKLHIQTHNVYYVHNHI